MSAHHTSARTIVIGTLVGFAFVAIGGGLTATTVAAQHAPQRVEVQDPAPAPGDELRIVAVDTKNFPEVTATVALPARAQHAGDLSADLSVVSSGAPVAVAAQRLPTDRQPVAILLDTSIDVQPSQLTADIGEAAEFVHEIEPLTPIIVGTSSQGVVFGPDPNLTDALAAMSRLQVAGSRSWPSAIEQTLMAMGSAPRSTVIVVSEGPSQGDAVSTHLVDQLATQSVTVRWFSRTADSGPVGELQGIQDVRVDSADALLVRLDSISADIAAQYRIVFSVDPRATSASISLTVGTTTWSAQTPLPFPGPAFDPPQVTAPIVASEAPVPPALPSAATAPSASTSAAATPRAFGARVAVPWLNGPRNFFAANELLFSFGLAALLTLLVAIGLAIVRPTPTIRSARTRSTNRERRTDLRRTSPSATVATVVQAGMQSRRTTGHRRA